MASPEGAPWPLPYAALPLLTPSKNFRLFERCGAGWEAEPLRKHYCAPPRDGGTIGLEMLNEENARRLLLPFGLDLNSAQLACLLTYLHLLLRWNRRINLTAIRDPEQCVTRLFGESLYLARWVELRGRLLDVGSGAGFPGLTLKIAFPALAATLLEPVAKKRAFLKEAARACQLDAVEVRGERLETFARLERSRRAGFDAATSRAVGHYDEFVPCVLRCLKPEGSLFLWLTHEQGSRLGQIKAPVEWQTPLRIPLTEKGEIWCGIKKGPKEPR